MKHGTRSAYNHDGCRCEMCTKANTEHQRKQSERMRAKPKEEIPHGYNGYSNYACRCEVCRAAGRQRNGLYQKRLTRAAKWVRQNEPGVWAEILASVKKEELSGESK